jgi:serine/threonine-protein kinase
MSPQSSIAHYRIVSKLGEGGMGEVWRATDTKLGRDVALKILPDAFASDADRMARFKREAQVLAALNHPNIAQIYGVEERALVMELVEGETLRGPLPIGTAVQYARQIADALEAAHERGVVHRDLKPANIKVRPDGAVKVLDFGLAKSAEQPSLDSQNSPTLTMRATVAGVIMGTAAYMSPEQAAGKPVDKRADIWSFGVVLWEMLTGHRLFDGETISHTLADVLRGPIDLGKLPKDTPPSVRSLIGRCLERDVRKRLRDIGEGRILLENPTAEAGWTPAGQRIRALPWIVAAGLAILAAIALWAPWRSAASEEKPVHFRVDLPKGVQFVLGRGGGSAISPDGRNIAFIALSSGAPTMWLRRLDLVTPHELPGTEGAHYPFWSPDSRSVAFFADGKLKRIDLAGGPPAIVADAPTPRGGTWNEEGTIVFSGRFAGQGLQRVPVSGGVPSTLIPIDAASGESSQSWPQFLPGGRRFLYFSLNRDPRKTGVFLGSLDHPSERTWLVESASGALYIAPTKHNYGYLLWSRQETLIARPFDPSTARFTGEVLRIPDAESSAFLSGSFNPGISASNGGDILFASGSERYRLGWFSRKGNPIGVVGQPDNMSSMRIAPDGTRVSVTVVSPSGGQRDISVIDFARGLQTRMTAGGIVVMTIWSPDSRRVV